jgi:radical SAM superfamily enzyme YgiQ (UPF0313 family)
VKRSLTVLLVKAARVTLPGTTIVPPLGLMYLASRLRQDIGCSVHVLDTNLSEDWRRDLGRALDELAPDVLGISALSVERRHAKAVARFAKGRRPGLPIMVGGPHATSFPTDLLAEPSIDAVLVGEGEEVIARLVEALVGRGAPGALPGVYTAAFPPGKAPVFAPIPDVDALPLPAWDLVRPRDYFAHRSMSGVSSWAYAVMATSRGCPYRCTFCHNVHGKRFRPRSVESVKEEMELLGRVLGTGVVEFLDDGFNLDTDRAKRILEAFVATGGRLRPAFPNGLRADRADLELLDLVKAARSPLLAFAVESASPRIQKLIRKDLDLDRTRVIAEAAARRGLYTNGFFMLGFPGETRAEMLQSIRYAVTTPFSMAYFFKVVPYPGTGLWESVAARLPGIEDRFDADFYSSPFNLSAVSDREFAVLYWLAYAAFYGRPGTLWGLMRKYPVPSDLFGRAAQSIALLTRSRAQRTHTDDA